MESRGLWDMVARPRGGKRNEMREAFRGGLRTSGQWWRKEEVSSRNWGSRARTPSDGVFKTVLWMRPLQPPPNAIRRGHEISGVTRVCGVGGQGRTSV